jgi:DNA repair protein RadC
MIESMNEHELIGVASGMIREAMARQLTKGPLLSQPAVVRTYLQLQFLGQGHESLVVLYLDARHRLIASEELFRGTLTHVAIYPREVLKRVLYWNACSIVIAHNHPDGVAEPSGEDKALTSHLKTALAYIDVRVLDHFVIGADGIFSFAEHGLM